MSNVKIDKKNILNYIITLAILSIFGYLFVRGTKYKHVYSDYIEVKTDLYIVVSIIVIVFILSILLSIKFNVIEAFKNLFDIAKKIVTNKNTYISLVTCGLGLPLAIVIEKYCFHIENVYHFWGLFIIFALGAIMLINRKFFSEKIYILFFIVAMSIGLFNVFAAPFTLGVTWDDEAHYKGVVTLSWIKGKVISNYDETVISSYIEALTDENRFTREQKKANIDRMRSFSEEYPTMVETGKQRRTIHDITYVFAALGVILGRALFNNYLLAFCLGRIMNLLAYSLAISFAIKNMKKKGGVVAAIIGLIPTNIFLASTYSYDWWVICLIILGYSFVFRDLEEQGKISTKSLFIALIICSIGILPKAVYFPLLLPMFLFSSKSYENPKISRVVIIISVLALLGSFMIPAIFGGKLMQDSRGGDVNAAGQVSFILSNPDKYYVILCNFLKTYLGIDFVGAYLTAYAYYGNGAHSHYVLLFVVVASLLDNNSFDNRPIGGVVFKIGTALGAILSIVLIVTALYVSYNPVGSETINGCQYRYLLPILFVFWNNMCWFKMEIPSRIKNAFTMGAMICMTYFLFDGLYTLVLCRY